MMFTVSEMLRKSKLSIPCVSGLEIEKSSGHLLVTNWRNIVARCKFLVVSLYNINDAAYSVCNLSDLIV